MKKILSITLVVVLLAGIAVSGTMAYLQDTDSDVNVMTLGKVDIEQIEQEWNADKTELQDFTQAKPLYPYVGILGWENKTENDGAYRRFTMNNVVDKYVTVKNTGRSDAYVRTFIALEMGSFSYEDFQKIGVSINKIDGDEFDFDGAWNWTDDFVAEIDGKNYNVMVAVHEDAIAPGEETIPSLLQVYLSKDATNEDVAKLDGNGNGTYDILVFSEAVQTEGFADAKTALNTAFGDTAEPTRYHPWSDGAQIPIVVSSVDDMREAMKTPESIIVLSSDVVIDDDKNTGYCLYAKYDCTIDLNGHDLVVDLDGEEFYGVIYALNGAKVDIVGDGNVEINGGIGPFTWCTGANGPTEVNIYGGNWVQKSPDFDFDDSDKYCEGIYSNREGVTNIYGGFFNWETVPKYTVNESREGEVNIYGGTFVNFDPSVSHDSDGSYVAEGYTVVSETQSNGDVWYTVVPE